VNNDRVVCAHDSNAQAHDSSGLLQFESPADTG